MNDRLSPKDIEFEAGGTTELKLSLLPQLMSIQTTARMVGDYDNSRPLLVADKFAGTVTAAIGFMSINGMYIPRSALRIDMRDITIKDSRRRIAAIFSKPKNDVLYKKLTYIAKGIELNSILKSDILDKVDIENVDFS